MNKNITGAFLCAVFMAQGLRAEGNTGMYMPPPPSGNTAMPVSGHPGMYTAPPPVTMPPTGNTGMPIAGNTGLYTPPSSGNTGTDPIFSGTPGAWVTPLPIYGPKPPITTPPSGNTGYVLPPLTPPTAV